MINAIYQRLQNDGFNPSMKGDHIEIDMAGQTVKVCNVGKTVIADDGNERLTWLLKDGEDPALFGSMLVWGLWAKKLTEIKRACDRMVAELKMKVGEG